MDGLHAILADEQLEDKNLKQNLPISAKASNGDEMLEALARLDRFDLTRTLEPRRGPNVPLWRGDHGLIIRRLNPARGSGAGLAAALEAREALRDKMSQKELRQWKRKMRGHRGFTVLRHPALRAHDAFCRHILTTGEGSYRQLRNTLMRRYKVPLPKDGPDAEYDREAHRAAFVAFLKFLKGNLAGQTSIRVDAAWVLRPKPLGRSPDPSPRRGVGQRTPLWPGQPCHRPRRAPVVEPGLTLGDIYAMRLRR